MATVTTSAMRWGTAALLAGVLGTGACTDAIDVGESMNRGDGGSGGPIAPDSDSSLGADAAVLQCASPNCAPGYATCAGSKFTCDVDLRTNANHCGSCEIACPSGVAGLNARSVCADGQCRPSCNAGYADCNGIPDDGCEQILNDVNHCGACGHACAAGEPCIDIAPFVSIGKCGCPDGKVWCGSRCIDLSHDDQNCGACGEACPPPPDGAPALGANMHYGCVDSQCGVPKCDPPSSFPPLGHADCNDDPGDGCETNVFADDANCGSCGRVCPEGQTCAILTPEYVAGCACAEGLTRCTQDSSPGFASCVDLLTDRENCGACGARCAGNEGVICDNGICVQLCPDGFAECNGDPRDPCETNIMTDPYNCGGCQAQCDVALPQACQNGRCWTEPCDAGGVGLQ